MTRRSSRLKIVENSADASNADNTLSNAERLSDDEDESKSRPKKKKKTTDGSSSTNEKRRIRGTRGILNQLTEMPLDILFETFGQLHPLDLLHLSRTTKALRAIMMSRSAVTIWKRALSSVPKLPECPENWSEPCYANLMFTTCCHSCLKSSGNNIIWGLRFRLCQKCSLKGFAQYMSFVDYSDPNRHYLSDILEFAPVTQDSSRRQIVSYYHEESVMRLKEDFAKLTTEEDRKIWLSERQQAKEQLISFSKLCDNWIQRQIFLRTQELLEVQRKRLNDIIQRLMAMGWENELKYESTLENLKSHSLVKQTKALSDRIWNNIKPTLVEYLEGLKAKRLISLKKRILEIRQPLVREIWEEYTSNSPADAIIPSAADIYFFPPIRAVIEDTYYEQELTRKDFQAALEQFPQLCHAWREEKDQVLLRMIQKATGANQIDGSYFNLATTFFRCRSELLTYPRVLVHQGASGSDYYHSAVNFFDGNGKPKIWNYLGQISFYKEAHQAACAIVKICSLDPLTATSNEMDALNPILECAHARCRYEYRGQAMTWRRAVEHSINNHPNTEVIWKLLEEPLAGKLRDRINEAMMQERMSFAYKGLRCASCSHQGNILELKKHLREQHSKTEFNRDDIVRVLDSNHIPPSIYYVTEVLQW